MFAINPVFLSDSLLRAHYLACSDHQESTRNEESQGSSLPLLSTVPPLDEVESVDLPPTTRVESAALLFSSINRCVDIPAFSPLLDSLGACEERERALQNHFTSSAASQSPLNLLLIQGDLPPLESLSLIHHDLIYEWLGVGNEWLGDGSITYAFLNEF